MAAQVRHRLGEQFAQMSYIIADAQAELDLVPAFLEALIKDCGEKGAFYLLSDLKSDSVLIEAFRQVDFNVWAKQRFYRLEDGISVPVQEDTPWRLWTNADLKAIHALCKSLVPKLFQNFEPLTRKTATVLVNDAPDGSCAGLWMFILALMASWLCHWCCLIMWITLISSWIWFLRCPHLVTGRFIYASGHTSPGLKI